MAAQRELELGELVAADQVHALDLIEEVVGEEDAQGVADPAMDGGEPNRLAVFLAVCEAELVVVVVGAGLRLDVSEVGDAEGAEPGLLLAAEALAGDRVQLPVVAELDHHAAVRRHREGAVEEHGVEAVLDDEPGAELGRADAERVDALAHQAGQRVAELGVEQHLLVARRRCAPPSARRGPGGRCR